MKIRSLLLITYSSSNIDLPTQLYIRFTKLFKCYSNVIQKYLAGQAQKEKEVKEAENKRPNTLITEEPLLF